MPSEHARVLVQTREKLVRDRRIYAAKLAGEGQSEEFERWRPIFTQIQETIEAVDRALLDEGELSGNGAAASARPRLEPVESGQAGNPTPYY